MKKSRRLPKGRSLRYGQALIVFLEAERFGIVAYGAQGVRDIVDHFAQPADVGVESDLAPEVPRDVLLHVAGVALPAGLGAA